MRILRWHVLLLLLLCTSSCKRHAPQPAARSGLKAGMAVANSAIAVASAQTELLALQTTPMDGDVPPPIQQATVRLKDILVTFTDEELATQPAAATAKRVSEVLNALLPPSTKQDSTTPKDSTPRQDPQASSKGEGKIDFEKPEAGDYGDALTAEVTSPEPGLLLVQENFTVQCGEDNLLLGYSNASGAWKRVLRWQAPAYKTVNGAFGDWYETRLLNTKRNGHPVLLVLHGAPWCTSTMSAFSVDTLELNPDAETETAFFHMTHGYRRADDDPPASLKVLPDGFEVRASVNDWDTGRISRKGVMRYRMAGNSFQRALPIAMNARESVNEWMSMDHAEAALFTDAPAASAVWQMWQTLTYEGKPEGAIVPSTRYGSVRACSDSAKHFQVEIDTSTYTSGNKPDTPGPTYYVQAEETGNGYRLHDAPTSPNPACDGRTVMAATSN